MQADSIERRRSLQTFDSNWAFQGGEISPRTNGEKAQFRG